MSLPIPNAAALAHSHQVTQYIKNSIRAAGGQIPFNQFMELALYAPELGYYSSGQCQFNASGDFVTAPEISPLFSQCLAKQCAQVFESMSDAYILELGAGSGIMAAEILQSLAATQQLPQKYLIFEPSKALQERQQQLFQSEYPQLLKYIDWLDALPQNRINAVILANEVVDAMPVQRFQVSENGIHEYYVRVNNEDFVWHLDAPSSAESLAEINEITQKYLNGLAPYTSEVNLQIKPWLRSLNQLLNQGLILIFDYGYPQAEYYHPQRDEGSLQCFFQHHHHANPLIYPGIQDITTHVDFTSVAQTAHELALEISGFTTQAGFLLGCDLAKMAQISDPVAQLNINEQIKILTSPSEMGELIKVIALTRDLETDLIGFTFIDRLWQL